MSSPSLAALRIVARLEGASFLLLLFVAMPLKYIFHLKLGVRIVGAIHGVLFLGFVSALFRVTLESQWSWRLALRIFVLSLLPFGFVPIERYLRDAPSTAR